MQEGNGRQVLCGGVGAAMAASILLGPVAPMERAIAFSDVGGAPVLGEEGAIHLARQSWLEANDALDELVHGGLSGKDEEEGPIAERKVLSRFLPVEHEEKGETPTLQSVVQPPPALPHLCLRATPTST